MKRLAAAIAIALSLSTSAHCLTFDWEDVRGYKPAANGYAINYGYSIAFIDDAIRVDVDVRLWGATVVDTLLDRWESGIESIWSTDRFAVPILFNVDWVSDAWDHSVRVVAGEGRWNTGTFYTVGAGSWGDSYQEEVAAHEYGHFLGLFDEYLNGALNPDTLLRNTGGLMHTLAGGTLDAYYQPFLSWYDSRLAEYGGGSEDPAPVPEPGTVVLFAAGLFAIAVKMKRREV
jgi:hypothetical protein